MSITRHFLFIVFVIFISCIISTQCDGDLAFTLQEKMAAFSNCDVDNDGNNEIDSLQFASFEDQDEYIHPDSNLVLVMLESRLFDPGSGNPDHLELLLNKLKQFKSDLREEGYDAYCIEAKVYGSSPSQTNHQDGLTLLALREFFKSVKAQYTKFKGVIFVGSFPEAMLVRRYINRMDPKVEDGDYEINGTTVSAGTSYLSIVPEIIAHRAEIVTADLDGNWHNLYFKHKELEGIKAVPEQVFPADWPGDDTTFISALYEKKLYEFNDFFFIGDDDVYKETDPITHRLTLSFRTAHLHPELTDADKELGNPIARPDILVSRINARCIAVDPDPNLIGINGKTFLDQNRKPQTVVFKNPVNLDMNDAVFWKRDLDLERKVIIDFFIRNHMFRGGTYSSLVFRETSIAYELSAESMHNILKYAAPFDDYIVRDYAKLTDYVSWLQEPGVLRGIAAHSNPSDSYFAKGYEPVDLENAAGGHPWRWKEFQIDGKYYYVPTFVDQYGAANFYVYRTLWENKKYQKNGAFLYVHNGCEANSPSFAPGEPYNSIFYGLFQNMECLLFYGNGLAVLSRAKGFYDVPAGFQYAFIIDPSAPFGAGWKHYFTTDGNYKAIASKPASCKRTYPWSVIGDWTLKIDY